MTTQTTQTIPSNWEVTEKPHKIQNPAMYRSLGWVGLDGSMGMSNYTGGWYIKGSSVVSLGGRKQALVYYAYNRELGLWIKRGYPYPPKRY